MLPKITKFGAVFTTLYVIALLVANAVLGTKYSLALFPAFTLDTFILALIAGAIAWLWLSDEYELRFSFGEGFIAQIINALAVGLVVAIASAVLGTIVYSIFSGLLTSAVWFAVYMIIQVPLNGLVIYWLTERG